MNDDFQAFVAEQVSSLQQNNLEKQASNSLGNADNNDVCNASNTFSDSVNTTNQPASPNSNFHNNSKYPGDVIEEINPLKPEGYQRLPFDDPALFVCFYNKQIRDGKVTLHTWQTEELEKIGNAKPTALKPYKFCLVTCNGSGKDAFIIASTVVWFAGCKVRSRVIVTSSSGVQLTSQTEGYIRTLCQAVNEYHGEEIFRIRQRFITCNLSGSEIRLFATDEAGKAEGYHPMDPDAEMMIVVNEGKSVSEEIHGALRRCTGYNYWIEVSTPGEPSGFFYKAAQHWPNVRYVSTYDCPHLSKDEVEEDKRDLGEHSALFRSKHLALFTTIGGDCVIPEELIIALLKETFDNTPYSSFPIRIGGDLAAGGDEIVLSFTQGLKCVKEIAWREKDTEISADRIDYELKEMKIPKDHQYIYMDDGGVGRSIIDKLIHKGWNINRVLNQSPATNKTLYGNKGAENWYRVKRLFEERLFDPSTLSPKTREQLYTRHFKSKLNGARLFLESKKEAKAEGRPSPDRADALILSLTGVTVDTFLSVSNEGKTVVKNSVKFLMGAELLEHYENEFTFGSNTIERATRTDSRKLHNSLTCALKQ